MFRYTPEQIADMSPYVQIAVYNPEVVAETITFSTMEEYLEWMTRR